MEPSSPLYVRPSETEPKEPFEGDLFERRSLAERLTAFIRRLPQGGVFAIDAQWGNGKSWFGRHWNADLRRQNFRTVYLDAFRRDYVDDPFVMISAELISALRDTSATSSKKIATAAKNVGKALLPTAAKVAVASAGRLVFGSADAIDDIRETVEKATEAAADATEKAVEKRVQRYDEEKANVDGFKAVLNHALADQQLPLIVFVDELDRCKPSFAVQTVERIKHFFDVPGLVFVLLLNRAQLEEAVKGVYGQGIDGQAYLAKFINFYLTLPKKRSTEYAGDDFNYRFTRVLLQRYGLSRNEADTNFARQMGLFLTVLNLSYRDAERAVVLYSLGQPLNNSAHIASWPIALKLCRPDLFSGILIASHAAHKLAAEILSPINKAHPGNRIIEFYVALHEWMAGNRTGSPNPPVNDVIQSLGAWRSIESYVSWLFERFDLAIRE